MSSPKRNLPFPPIDPKLLGQLRAGLIEDYKHKPMPDVNCALCGAPSLPLALHVLEFSHSDAVPTPLTFVPMSQSRGSTRGSVPVCLKCAPRCGTCALPVATPWTYRMGRAL